jgi:hypothetical protein
MPETWARGGTIPLVRFPPGEPVFANRPFDDKLFAEVDDLLAKDYLEAGWLDIETPDARLTCLIHQKKPYLAGLTETGSFAWVPLRDLVLRARQLEGAICGMYHGDPLRVLMMAVHFRNRPDLQASTNLVDLGHVLAVLAQQGHDAALALQRAGTRTLMFLAKGVPARLYFGDYRDDPANGSVTDRFLQYGFAPEAPVSKVEVFHRLKIEPDPDASKSLVQLERESLPPPPVSVQIRMADKLILQRMFMPPCMIIGRDPHCELPLDNLGVSRRHARLCWERGRFVLEDLGSANGTLVNAQAIQRCEVTPRDQVSVGKFNLRLSAPSGTPAPQATLMINTHEQPRLLYLVGNDQTVPVESEVTIGKAEGVDVRLRGWSIRPIHARLRNAGDGDVRLTCVGKASVVHNGKKIQSANLRADDEIRIASTAFRLMSVPHYRPQSN